MKNSSLKIKSKLWIVDQEDTFLGEGRIRLLKAIEEYGSITKAAGSMKMSYLKAWKLVQSMNRTAGKELVIKTSGGKGGGGTTLTKKGKSAIEMYQKLNNSCQQFLDVEFEKLMKDF